jgi:hypothetical protein
MKYVPYKNHQAKKSILSTIDTVEPLYNRKKNLWKFEELLWFTLIQPYGFLVFVPNLSRRQATSAYLNSSDCASMFFLEF